MPDHQIAIYHLKNIYQKNEVDQKETAEDFSVVQNEGKRQVARDVEFYNLDAILSGKTAAANYLSELKIFGLRL